MLPRGAITAQLWRRLLVKWSCAKSVALRSHPAAAYCRCCRLGKTDPPSTPPLLGQLIRAHRLFVARKALEAARLEVAYLDDWTPLNQALLRAGWRVPVGQEQAWLDGWGLAAYWPRVILPPYDPSDSDLN